MAVAPSSRTGRSWCRYTASVTRVPRVAAQVSDVLDPDPATRQQRHEAVRQLPGRPVLTAACLAGEPAERAPDVAGQQFAPEGRAEHEIVVLPARPCLRALTVLNPPMPAQSRNAPLRGARVRRDFLVFVS